MLRLCRGLAVALSLFVVTACGDSDPPTEGSVLVRTALPFAVDSITSQVFCGSPETLIVEGGLASGPVNLDGFVIWTELIEGLPPGDCTAVLEANGTDTEDESFTCTGDGDFTSTAGRLADLEVLLECDDPEDETTD